jgi:NADPH:quinone reductase-like Zn-dependent oxidoreductase
LGISIVTGNTMTTACILQYIKREIPLNSNIYINGATSSIGLALILKCCELNYNVTFYTKSEERAKN